MNDYRLVLGPCTEYDFDLAELVDGTLAPERVATVRTHVSGCERCRRYVEDLREVDDALAASLPRPDLGAGFDERLRERIVALRAPVREIALADAEHEFAAMLTSLRRGFGVDAVLNGLALVSVAGGIAAALMIVAPSLTASLGLATTDVASAVVTSLAAVAGAMLAGGRLTTDSGLA